MFVQLHLFTAVKKGARVINHRGEVDRTIMPHWPTVNEVIPFITAQSGTAGCSLVLPPTPQFAALISRRQAEVTCCTPQRRAPLSGGTNRGGQEVDGGRQSSSPRMLSIKVCLVAFEGKRDVAELPIQLIGTISITVVINK